MGIRASWLLEKDIFLESFIDQLVEVLVEQGRDFWWVDYAPFGATMSLPIPGVQGGRQIGSDDCVVAYGSINIVRRLLRENPWFKNVWQPTAWMNLENMECKTYYSHWRRHMLVRENAFTTWSMLGADEDFYFDRFSSEGCLFVKPNQNLKLFSGKVIRREEFKKWRSVEEDCYEVPRDCLCVVAKPCSISGEWRFVVADHRVVTGSQYRLNGRSEVSPDVDPKAWLVAEMLAHDSWQPDVAYVADVARSGDVYGLLEIGSVNSAGLYACDPRKVADSLSVLAEREYAETKE